MRILRGPVRTSDDGGAAPRLAVRAPRVRLRRRQRERAAAVRLRVEPAHGPRHVHVRPAFFKIPPFAL